MADLAQLETSLHEHQFLGGDLPSAQDKKVFAQLGAAPDKQTHPNLWAWYTLIAQFSDDVRSSWPEEKKPEPTPAPKVEEAKVEEVKAEEPAEAKISDAEAKANAQEDLDLFAAGDDEEEEDAGDAFAKAKAAHAAPVGRSILTLDVKPANSTVDLDAVNARIRNEIQPEGLKWSEEFAKVPVAYGICKLRLSAVILDSISTDDIIERIEAFTGLIEPDSDDEEYEDEEEGEEGAEAAPAEAAQAEEAKEAPKQKELVEGKIIQSVDIASFQKL
eukprot:CAMPEP_0204902808 /NCGR_PEP_ID=MMETSP1397-20131031/3883_1 /ASSEMBLY_ACC=CAM_ASM_000891 /TAXON_ID=49980 /ORGANISM="Climacostomum Climacostomum virens, Strain Stock W-24" /LENGTH=273 /DNA_ID=CAMNT_0052071363 /DNA_START=296 /DNA_END=1117 /DNA_ORIENTATION=+